MPPSWCFNPLRALVFALVCTALLDGTAAYGQGDDTYRFTPGAGVVQVLNLEATSEGARWTWSCPSAAANWDSALLGLRLRALKDSKDEPRVEFITDSFRIVQHVERDINGLRWLNISGLRGQVAQGRPVDVRGHGVLLEPGPAQLRLFTNHLKLEDRVLILAPHPDDAEIAAFGVYAGSKATIVTVTSGNAGDANYRDHFSDPAEQYRFKGFLRVMDSVTVPWMGGIPPERCFNLGYFDARLSDMHAKPREAVAEMYGPNRDTSVYRRANLGGLLGKGPRTNTWAHFVQDLVAVFQKVRPRVIILPHPFLDTHEDHAFTAVATLEALEQWKAPVTLLLYTNHAGGDRYPYGPAGTPAPLPPWSGRELEVEGFYAHPVNPETQRLKLFALDGMHDLRLSPTEQAACLTGDVRPQRGDYPRAPEVDYFRRGPRPEELFLVSGREGFRRMVQRFLESRKE